MPSGVAASKITGRIAHKVGPLRHKRGIRTRRAVGVDDAPRVIDTRLPVPSRNRPWASNPVRSYSTPLNKAEFSANRRNHLRSALGRRSEKAWGTARAVPSAWKLTQLFGNTASGLAGVGVSSTMQRRTPCREARPPSRQTPRLLRRSPPAAPHRHLQVIGRGCLGVEGEGGGPDHAGGRCVLCRVRARAACVCVGHGMGQLWAVVALN